MELHRRDVLGLGGLAALAALLPGCASALPEADVSAAGFGEDATGTVRLWCRAATVVGVRQVVDAFNASQDAVTVEVTPVLDGQYVTKLATAIRGGNVPDIVDIDDINSMLFIYRDSFTDLTPLVQQLDFAAQLNPGQLGLATRNGRHYGVPYIADNSALFYNTELFERAGLDPVEQTQDLDGLLEAARAIGELGEGTYGWSVDGNAAGILGFVVQPHIWAAKMPNVVGDVGAQRGSMKDNDAVRRTFAFYRTLWTEKLMPQANFSGDGSRWGADFRDGKVGMIPANFSVAALNASEEMRAKTGVVLLPGPDGGRATFAGGDNLCIPRGAPNASGAWQFAKFALDLPQQANLPAGGYIPVRSDAATDEYRRTFPLAVAPLDGIAGAYAPTTLAYNLLFNQQDSPWIAAFRRAVFDGDLDGALEQGQKDFDRILEQAQL
ncbi:ABC transporter substrate-binding protein [Kineococcus rhizosphaerae]|uniref:Carbohydrate ABC transporter substrate-binding protein (CUT1 family) n=1 Tax=Kineococcus rhizosphaerae TaxID=559628 RepID=A0A2T0R6I2_9ACTN|nr:sugar ABC transporter substrate-binding protein [Kineococcus rhizosphaerae]PRY16763.1 carbohydrate ABC transporter substrate-binding protein (CUT1 family) [Kineococcus rhizosphaerae]